MGQTLVCREYTKYTKSQRSKKNKINKIKNKCNQHESYLTPTQTIKLCLVFGKYQGKIKKYKGKLFSHIWLWYKKYQIKSNTIIIS